MQIKLNVRRLLDDLPFEMDQLPTQLQVIGVDSVGLKAVRAWYRRNSIHGDRLAEVLYVARISGREMDINDYIDAGGNHGRAAA
jgi:hypothetical protein